MTTSIAAVRTTPMMRTLAQESPGDGTGGSDEVTDTGTAGGALGEVTLSADPPADEAPAPAPTPEPDTGGPVTDQPTLTWLETLGRGVEKSSWVATDVAAAAVAPDKVGLGLSTPIAAASLFGAGTGAQVLYNASRRPPGATTMSLKREIGVAAATSSFKLTPLLVAGIGGPLVADVLTKVAPNLLPKLKVDPKTNKPEKPEEAASIKLRRGFAAFGAVGAGSAGAMLLKPEVFQRNEKFFFGSFRMLEEAVPNGVFANRVVLGAVGAVAAAGLLIKMTNSSEEDKEKWRKAAIGTGVGTAAVVAAVPLLTKGHSRVKLPILPADGIIKIQKPNMKQFGMDWLTKVMPVTAAPAYTSASNYTDLFTNLGNITNSKSDFRK